MPWTLENLSRPDLPNLSVLQLPGAKSDPLQQKAQHEASPMAVDWRKGFCDIRQKRTRTAYLINIEALSVLATMPGTAAFLDVDTLTTAPSFLCTCKAVFLAASQSQFAAPHCRQVGALL
jgi:hypothetical protein